MPHYLWPLLTTIVLLNAFEKQDVLLNLPGPFLQLRVEVAVPMLAALLSVSIDFVRTIELEIESLGYLLPIFSILFIRVVWLFDDGGEKSWLFLSPAICGQVDFLETQPLEHTGLRLDSGNKGGYCCPILMYLSKEYHTKSFSTSLMPCKSQYLLIIQTRICTSSSLQFFLTLLFFAILCIWSFTFKCVGLPNWGWLSRLEGSNALDASSNCANSEQLCPRVALYSPC